MLDKLLFLCYFINTQITLFIKKIFNETIKDTVVPSLDKNNVSKNNKNLLNKPYKKARRFLLL